MLFFKQKEKRFSCSQLACRSSLDYFVIIPRVPLLKWEQFLKRRTFIHFSNPCNSVQSCVLEIKPSPPHSPIWGQYFNPNLGWFYNIESDLRAAGNARRSSWWGRRYIFDVFLSQSLLVNELTLNPHVRQETGAPAISKSDSRVCSFVS